MAKQRLVKKGGQYGILDEASNTVLPISENMKLVQKQGRYGILDGDSVMPIDNFSESITDADLDILKKKNSTESVGQPIQKPTSLASPKIQGSGLVASPAKQELPSTGGDLLRAPEKPKPYNLTDKSWLENKQDINVLSKDVINQSKIVASSIKSFNNDSKLFQDDITSFQELSKTNPSNPELITLQQDLQKRQEDLNQRSQSLNSQAREVDVANLELKKKALENYKKKAEQGNWGGAFWNSIITGLERSGQGFQRSTIDAGIELLDYMGIPYASKEKESELRNQVIKQGKNKLTEEEIDLKVKDLAKKEVIGTFKPILKKGYEGIKSKGTTEEFIQEKKESGVIPLALLGVAESIPIMASGGYGQFATGAMQTYANLNEQMDNDPALAGMDENDRKKITLPISIISGYLEQVSFGKLLKKGAPVLTPIVGKFVSSVLSKIPPNATMDLIGKATKEFAESTAGRLLLKGGTEAARAYGIEAETGGLQSASEMLIKEIYDKANNIDLFKNPELLSKEFLGKVIYDANVEGIGGLIMGGPIMAAQSVFSGKQISNDDFVAMKSLIQDPENAQLTISKIASDLSSGAITKEDADSQLKALNESKRILDLIPDKIPEESQRKAFSILADNAKIQSELEQMSKDIIGKDPNLVTDVTALMKEKEAQIEKNNQELSKLPKNAIPKQATSEVPVQPEAGGSLQVAEGESQAEPQVPTQEVEVKEVTTPIEEVKPTEMSTEEWSKVQNLADRIYNGEEISSAEDLQLQENYPQTIETLLSKKIETPQEETQTTPTKLSDEQKSAIQEGVKLGNDMVKRYPKQDDLITKYKALQKFQKKNQQYIDADQSQRDEMTKQINYALGLAPKKSAPSVKSILGIKPTMVTVDQMESLREQLILQEKAAKGGVDFANKAKKLVNATIKGMKKGALDARATNSLLTTLDAKAETPEQRRDIISKVISIFKKTEGKIAIDEIKLYNDQIKIENKASQNANKIRNEVIDKIKSFVTRGALSKAQQKSLLNSLAKTNILNPVMRERLFERMQKMFNRADYQDRIKEATTFRNRIKKLAKSDTLQGSVAKMAKEFSKVITEFTDVDTYLEKAREVYDAIKNPIRRAALIEDINAFTQKELAKQEEKVKNTLLDQYDYLGEAGLIDESMSLAQIRQYVMDVESGTKPDATINESKIRENLSELFDSMTDIVNSIAEDGYNPLTGEGVELDDYTKTLIKNFSSMDLNEMSVRDSYRAIEALENFLVNGIVDNMETMYKTYEGAQKATGLANQGIVAESFRRVFGGKAMNFLSQAWTSAFSPVKSTLDLVHRSRAIGSKVFDAMGLRDLSNQSSRAKTEANNIDKAYNEKFGKTKPNDKSFNDVENVFERGIYAHLRRNVIGTAEEMKAEFDRRKGQIIESIDALLKSQDDKLVKRGKILDSIFENIKDAEDISQVEAYINPINQDAVKWWNTIFDKYYPEVKKVAASVYNTVLEDDINYSTDNYEKIVEDKSKDVNEPSSYRMGFDFLNQSKSGTLMKNNRIKGIPQNRVISFDFDFNNSSAFHNMLTDVRTAPAVQQYRGFTQSPAFEKIYPNLRDRNVIQNKLNYYVNQVRSKNVTTGSVNEKAFAKIIQAVSRYGTSRALGGALSGFKQASTALINTFVALVNDPKSVAQGIALVKNKDAMNFLNNSGYGIANRGLESQTAIESANKIIEQTDVNSANKVAEAVGKAGKIYLEYSLKNGDVLGARASWMAYYVHKLKQLGYNTDNIDWKNHELVKEAGDYAEDQVNLQQNVSDSAMMGKFLTTKNPYVTIARSMVVPFSSFIFNAKDKITTDVTILTSKNSNKQDKIDALKSLTATAAEMVAFEAMSAGISSGIVVAANAILGVDEDDDEIEKRRDQYINSAFTRFTTDVLSPIPNIGDKAVVGIINGIFDLAQKDLDEEDKFKLFSYKPQSEFDAMLNLIGGIPEVATKPFINMADTIYKISSDSYVDKYGNEIELSAEDKEKLAFILAVELLGATNILPSEVVRLNEKVKQTIEKEAR